MTSLGRELYQLGYEISPVILTGGIASQIEGQMMPIVALTQAADFTLGLLHGNIIPNLDNFFAHWKPLPGTTLINNQIGTYPFANQAVAGNALIAQPNTISMLMICPAQTQGGFTAKLATMSVLQQTLIQHNNSGGMYTVATPSGIFPNCILAKVTDVSGGESKQAQHSWQFDFVQPLITIDAAQQVYNSLMNKIANGLPTSIVPQWSGPAATVGQSLGAVASAVPFENIAISPLL